MTQDDLDLLFENFSAELRGKDPDDLNVRLGLFYRIFYEGHLASLPARDHVLHHLAVALCAVGPVKAGPPFLPLLEELNGLLPSPFSAVAAHEASVARIQRMIDQNEEELRNTGTGEERRVLREEQGRLRLRMRLTKDDNPCLNVAVWFGLVGEKPRPGAAWISSHPQARHWTGVWDAAEAWFLRQVTRACAQFEWKLGYWNRDLRGAFVRGKSPNDIVDRLIGPGPAFIRLGNKTKMTLEFTPMPAADGPIANPSAPGWYWDAWRGAGLRVAIGGKPYVSRRAETRFVFFTTNRDLQDRDRDISLPAESRVVCRVGDRETMVVCSEQNARGARLTERLPQASLTPSGTTRIRIDACGCGSESCEQKHSLRKWPVSANPNPYVSLRMFALNAVKGPVTESRTRAAVVNLAPNTAKTGMYYPFLAGGLASATGAPPVRHARCMVWQCNSPRCQPRLPAEGTTPAGIGHAINCPRDPANLRQTVVWQCNSEHCRPRRGQRPRTGKTPSKIAHAEGCPGNPANLEKKETWRCNSDQCRPRPPRKGAIWDAISHADGCDRDPVWLTRVEDEWFIPLDINAYTLRPYWGPETNLQPATMITEDDPLTERIVLEHPHFRRLTREQLLNLLPGYYLPPPRPLKTARAEFAWLRLAVKKYRKLAYQKLLLEFISTKAAALNKPHWPAHFRDFLSGNLWGDLLTRGCGSNPGPAKPLLVYEQYNLVVRSAREAGDFSRDVIEEPKFLWTKDYEQQ